jgi:hypothetical protein
MQDKGAAVLDDDTARVEAGRGKWLEGDGKGRAPAQFGKAHW